MVELTEFLVKSLVKNKDLVSVKQFENSDETVTIEVLVSNVDIGAVIGKRGVIEIGRAHV